MSEEVLTAAADLDTVMQLHTKLDQLEQAIEAEWRARALLEADAEVLRAALIHAGQMKTIIGARAIVQQTLAEVRPGRALLAELAAARAVVAAAREWLQAETTLLPIIRGDTSRVGAILDAVRAYDAIVEARTE